MRILPTGVHAALDFVWSACLLAAPVLVGFTGETIAVLVAVFFALLVVAYSLLTDYELSAVDLIPIRLHLLFDWLVGLALLAMPLAEHLNEGAKWSFVAFGSFSVLASVLTEGRASARIHPA